MITEIATDDTEPAAPCNIRLAFVRGALLLQEKWVMMILFDLFDGPRSFNQLMRKGSINTTTLAQRLHLLENAGILIKTVHSMMPPRTSYALTEAGHELRPIFSAIQEWAEKNLPTADEAEICPSQQLGVTDD